MITVKDVARDAGVSIGTVDRVLHGRGRVAPETEARVREAIRRLDYQPNLHARNLSQSKSYYLDVLSPAPDLDGGYWRLPLRGIERAVSRLSMNNIVMRKRWFNRHDESSFLRVLQEVTESEDGPPDGMLIAPVVSEAAQAELTRRMCDSGTALVTFDSRISGGPAVPFVGQDPSEGGRTAGRLSQLLRERGELVASVTLGRTDMHLAERARGFRDFWNSTGPTAGGKPELLEIMLDDRDEADYVNAIASRLSPVIEELSVAFVTNAASGLFIDAVKKIGCIRHIPLVGYDLLPQNVRLMEAGGIDVVISQKPEEQGYEAMNMLAQQVIFGKDAGADVLMPVEVIFPENLGSFLHASIQ